MQELWFLRSTHRLILIGIYMKFREDSVNGFQVIERTRFFDRQTPGGKTICLSRGETYRIVEINTCIVYINALQIS